MKEINPAESITRIESNSDLTREFGSHFLVELINCPPDKLRKVKDVKQIMDEVIRKSKTSLVDVAFHQFEPEGVSGVFLIKESHVAIHTWPEESYAAADIFTCGQEMDAYIAIEVMKEKFEAEQVRYRIIPRGF
ncbi:MAG: adenosylmethionine decarboxylase [Dehalococcoidales bacterium]|nr:adenosylmethionine decarboxylase [Dehalococcoidales bacterium]